MSAFSDIELEVDDDEHVGPIRHRLLHPQARVDLEGLAEVWTHTDVEFLVAGCGHAIGDPSFTGRIRGAFGKQLLESASPEAANGQPCPWDPPCAFEALFRKQGRMEPGLEFPSPWVVNVDSDGKDLKVTLRLLGFAVDYVAPAAEAMAAALVHHLQYAGGKGTFFPRAKLLGRSISTVQSLPPPEHVDELTLDFLSPTLLSSRDLSLEPGGLITTFGARLAGLARWHDVELEIDRGELRATIRSLRFTWLSYNRLRWERLSQRQGKVIPMSGATGRLVISGPARSLAIASIILGFAEFAHIGADIAYGCGRFEKVSNIEDDFL